MTSPATTPRWSITGDYVENCNCDVVCPCLFSTKAPMTSKPTAGACEVAFGFHVDRGTFGTTSLDGLPITLWERAELAELLESSGPFDHVRVEARRPYPFEHPLHRVFATCRRRQP